MSKIAEDDDRGGSGGWTRSVSTDSAPLRPIPRGTSSDGAKGGGGSSDTESNPFAAGPDMGAFPTSPVRSHKPTNLKIVRLNVGGTVFATSRSTLMAAEDSMLSVMLRSKIGMTVDASGALFIDRDPTFFRYILNYLRDGVVDLPDDPHILSQIYMEANYYQVSDLIKMLELHRKRLKVVMPREALLHLMHVRDELVLPSTVLAGLDLSHMVFRGSEFKLCDFSGCDLRSSTFSNCKSWRANYNKANMNGFIGTATVFDLASFRGASMVKARLDRSTLKGAVFRGADLSQSDLRGAILSDANLSGATLKWAVLVEVKLVRNDLSEADLEGANLEGADLSYANLRNANLKSANLYGVCLRGADLEGAVLKDANLKKAIMDGVVGSYTR